MGIGVFLTGTDTGVGKTAVTAALARQFYRRGVSVGVMKPVETGVAGNAPEQSDAFHLATAAATHDDMELIAPFRFQQPVAPLAAARNASQTIDQSTIVRSYQAIAHRHHITLVEGVGGLLVPIGDRWDVRDLIVELKLPVIVVGRSALGGINHARLTMEALHSRDIRIIALMLNQIPPITSALERDQTEATCRLLRNLLSEPVLGPLSYVEGMADNWPQSVDRLADDPAISALAELISGMPS
jgi:dethiobiotin synthetase